MIGMEGKSAKKSEKWPGRYKENQERVASQQPDEKGSKGEVINGSRCSWRWSKVRIEDGLLMEVTGDLVRAVWVVRWAKSLIGVGLRKKVGGFPGGAVVENPPANAGDAGLIPGPGGSHMPRSN